MRNLGTLLALCALLISPGAFARDLSIYISVDMEGTAGAVTGDQLAPGGFEYERFRKFMTAELVAAIEGARQAGATRILVSDSHGNGENLLIEQLPDDVMVVRSWPRPLLMMQGIEEGGFDGVILLGYHTAATNMSGVRAHTLSSAAFTAIRLNGKPVSEGAISAAIAGHYGVPVIMVSGDSQVVEESRAFLGDVEGAAVKSAYGFHSAKTLSPKAACNLIRAKARAAVERIDDFKPYRLKGPVTIDIAMKNYRPVEILSYLPIVERVDSHTVRYKAKDILDAVKFLHVVMSYRVDLTP